MKLLQLLTLAILPMATVSAQDSRRQYISLKEAIEIGISNNALVKQAEFQKDVTGVYLNQAKGNLIPQVGGNINHYLNQGRSINPANNGYINQQLTTANYTLAGNATLFNGLFLLNNLKKNEYAYAAGKLDWQYAKEKLMLDILQAYVMMLTNTDLLDQARRQADVTRQQVQRLETMNREGAIRPSDLSDLQGQYASDQLAFINAGNALDQARYTLVQLMNIPYDARIQAASMSADQFNLNYGNTPDSIYRAAEAQLAVIRSADLKVKSFRAAVQAAKGSLYPSLGIGAGISTNYSSLAQDAANNKIAYDNQLKNNYGTYIGAGISIPILNNLRFRNQVALAKIDYKSATFSATTARVQLRQNVERDYFDMTASVNRYRALVQQVDAYNTSFHAADTRFTEGVGTVVDYLIAKNNLDRAKTNLITGRYDYLLRIKILDYYQGKPLW